MKRSRRAALFFSITVNVWGQSACQPRGPTHIFYWQGVRAIFFGLKFWPKGILFGCMKDTGIFLGREKNSYIFLELYFSSAQKRNLLLVWDFFGGMLKKVGIFWGKQILKLGLFWSVWNMNLFSSQGRAHRLKFFDDKQFLEISHRPSYYEWWDFLFYLFPCFFLIYSSAELGFYFHNKTSPTRTQLIRAAILKTWRLECPSTNNKNCIFFNEMLYMIQNTSKTRLKHDEV